MEDPSAPPLSPTAKGADGKEHTSVNVSAVALEADDDKATIIEVNGTTPDKDDTIRELVDQLKLNTDRLAALEARMKALRKDLDLEEPDEDAMPERTSTPSSPVPDDTVEAEAEVSDVEEDDPDDNEDEFEDEQKETEKVIADRKKYVSEDEWSKDKLANKYSISLYSAPDLSVVVSRVVSSTKAHSTQPALVETDCLPMLDKDSFKPDRLVIPCATLLNEIAKVSGTTIGTSTNVFLRPFKNIIPFRQEYQESLKQNRELYRRLKKLKKERRAKYLEACKTAEEMNETRPAKEEKRLSSKDQVEFETAKKLYLGLICLLHFIDHDNADVMKIRQQAKDKDFEIAFDNIWHLFEPGQIVCPKGNKEQAYRVLNVGGGRPHRKTPDHDGKPATKSKAQKITDFFVDCFHIDFNGTHYVPTPLTIYISPYDGTRAIKNLPVRPLGCLYTGEEEKEFRKKLIDRGQKFEKLAVVSHQRYTGLSLRDASSRREEVDGDVIIDFALAFKNNRASLEERMVDSYVSFQPPGSDPAVTDYHTTQSSAETSEEAILGCSDPYCTICTKKPYTYDDSSFELTRRSRFLDSNSELLKEVERKLGPDRHILLPYRMYGYVLLSRKWYPLDIDLLEDIDESNKDSDGFRDLVLPEDHKDIVRALVKTHARGPRSASGDKGIPSRQMDLVKGKGKGLIILLHGVPGVGKTSTAECVAAHTNRPLFPITCGDIGGQTPREVEANLESYFDLARKWGCVLLLDEADVFLGKRTEGDIQQNSLVSVFLRVLEYYSGVLILTTNRVGQFDEAIKSRIHISLYYPPLNRERTMQIWTMNLERLDRDYGGNSEQSSNGTPSRKATLPRVNFNAEEIMNFARGHWVTCTPTKSYWNGRQIKNAFQTAIALAEWDAMDYKRSCNIEGAVPILLKKQHFKKVADASARFDKYLVDVRKTDSWNAKNNANRFDEFNDQGISSAYGIRYPTREEEQQQRKNIRRAPMESRMREKPDDQDEGERMQMPARKYMADDRTRREPMPSRMREEPDDQDDGETMQTPTRKYMADDRARREPMQLGDGYDREDRRTGRYGSKDRFNGRREAYYDDESGDDSYGRT